MEKFEFNDEKNLAEKPHKEELVFNALRQNTEEEILKQFTPEEQQEILRKKNILSSLAYFIGKDFEVPIELGLPTADCPSGWRQGKKDDGTKFLQMNAHDLLNKPMDFLRFVVGHEAGHARISRFDSVDLEVWKKPGFSFMSNSIEDPRDNNFVSESYPKFKEQMELAYKQDLGFETEAKEKAKEKLGFQPRFMQAGFEYIKQWFREKQGQDFEISDDLPEEVKAVVMATLKSAQDSWWRYPSREEADESEEKIKEYAKVSYEINLEEIWPEFKKLVDMDKEDQKMEEALKDMIKKMMEEMQKNEQENNEKGEDEDDMAKPQEGATSTEDESNTPAMSAPGRPKLPKELEEKLTEEEKKTLEDAIKNSESKPVNLDELSDEIKQKIKDYFDSLPEEVKKELTERAEKALKEFEDKLNEEMEGKLSENPEGREIREMTEKKGGKIAEPPENLPGVEIKPEIESEELKKYKEKLAEETNKDANVYEENRREVLPLIQKLENELREIFIERKSHNWKTGFKTGKKIDVKKRIQEKAKGVSAMESKSWQKREAPDEKDYSISLLVDLSGSMSGKIEETFKAVIVLAEVLNKLSINVEILGFNDKIYEYQKFGEQISKKIRENMGRMLEEVDTDAAAWNDDGWAVEQTADRLKKQKTDQKFLIALSDGQPVESPMHSREKYELAKMIEKIIKETDIKLVGLGIGRGTGHVARYYPHSIADVNVSEMAEKLAGLIKEVIVKYNKF